MIGVQSVIVQLGPDRITEGHYIIDGDTLIMTYDDGEPVDAFQHRHTLRPGDDAHAIAGLLTKKVRTALAGETVPGFSNALSYPNSGAA